MKLVVTLILVTVVSSIKAQMKTELKGIWELIPEKLTVSKSENNLSGFTFWIKLSEEEVIFSNSNNNKISSYAGSWDFYSGKCLINVDTLTVTFYEYGSISTNTGIELISVYKDLGDTNPLSKFTILGIKKDKLELVALNNFPYSNPNTGFFMGDYFGLPQGVYLNEKMTFRRTLEKHYWTDRIE